MPKQELLAAIQLLLRLEEKIGNGALATIRTTPYNQLELQIDWGNFHTIMRFKEIELENANIEGEIIAQAQYRYANREQVV